MCCGPSMRDGGAVPPLRLPPNAGGDPAAPCSDTDPDTGDSLSLDRTVSRLRRRRAQSGRALSAPALFLSPEACRTPKVEAPPALPLADPIAAERIALGASAWTVTSPTTAAGSPRAAHPATDTEDSVFNEGSPRAMAAAMTLMVDAASRRANKYAAVAEDDGVSLPATSTDSSIASERTLELEKFPRWRNFCRRLCITNPWFERFWLLIIFLNCLTLAMEEPTDHDCVRWRCQFTRVTDYIFTVLFTVECLVKMCGLGIWQRHDAYLRDSWNVLDCLIVLSGDIAFLLDVAFNVTGPGLTAARAFRALRPLKTMHAFPSVRVLVGSIIASVPRLVDVFILYSFFLLTMGIIAVDQWRGSLRMRCVDAAWNLTWDVRNATDAADPRFRYTAAADHTDPRDGMRICQKDPDTNLGGYHCRWGYQCIDVGESPYWDKVKFDHIGMASLTLFTGISLEGWTVSLYYTIDATTYLAAMYWATLIVVGSFFLLNVTIVIITEAFDKKQRQQRLSAFYAADRHGTGELNKTDVRRLLEKRNRRRVSDAELQVSFFEMDKDRGGTVTLDEFLAWEESHQGAPHKLRPGDCLYIVREKAGVCIPATVFEIIGAWAETPRKGPKEVLMRRRWGSSFREMMYHIVTGGEGRAPSHHPTLNKVFRHTILVAIVLNSAALGAEHYNQPELMTDILFWCNVGFTVIFSVEAVMKCVGLSVVGYLSDRFNVFDLFVVLMSWADLAGSGANVSVFRAFRVLRVLKLARQLPSLQRWMRIMLVSLRNAAVLTGLLGMLTFIAALLGMEFFGGEFCGLDADWDPTAPWVRPEELRRGKDCGGVPRSNYDTLWNAFVTSFQILSGEDWNLVMYNGMRSQGSVWSLYFVVYYTIGNYLMLNLFIAVLLNNRELRERESLLTVEATRDACRLSTPVSSESAKTHHSLVTLSSADELASDRASVAAHPLETLARGRALGGGGTKIPSHVAPDTLAKIREREWRPDWLRGSLTSDVSLCCFERKGRPRRAMVVFVESAAFEAVVVLTIASSCVSLAMEDPFRPPDVGVSVVLNKISLVAVCLFLFESAAKMFAYGAFLHPTSYWRRDLWNRLDLVIAVLSALSYFVPGGESIELVTLVRAVRPLRFINKSKGMKVVVGALLQSIGPLLNVIAISFLIFVIFGIMGVQMFSGQFYRCSMYTFGDMERGLNDTILIESEAQCLNSTICPAGAPDRFYPQGRPCTWRHADTYFDHLGVAILALYTMASLEGWVEVMYMGIDARGEHFAPRKDENPWIAIYFMVFVVFGSFFVVNVFIGVLIDTYYNEKAEVAAAGGFLLLNDAQRQWVQSHRRMIKSMQVVKEKLQVRFACLEWVTHPRFDTFIMVCIVLNVLAMATEHFPSTEKFDDAMRWINLIFVGVFLVEAGVKILAFGFSSYIRDKWNRLDFTIVVLSIAGVIISETQDNRLPVVSIFRVLRLTRLLRMVRAAKGIRRILRALFLSLPSLVNVTGIMTLLFFIYATLGVNLFAKVRRGEAMNAHAHFETFGHALLLLLRMSTGEAWQEILFDLSVSPPDCDERLNDCGRLVAAVCYFCTFTFAGMYVFLNLFVAVILDNFTESGVGPTPGGERERETEHFRAVWARHSTAQFGRPGAPRVLPPDSLEAFLRDLGPPLGPRQDTSDRKMQYFIIRLHLPATSYFHQSELLGALITARFPGHTLPPDERNRIELLSRKVLGARRASEPQEGAFGTVSISQHYASLRVQALLKAWLQRRRYVRQLREARGEPADFEDMTASFATVPGSAPPSKLSGLSMAFKSFRKLGRRASGVPSHHGGAAAPAPQPPPPQGGVSAEQGPLQSPSSGYRASPDRPPRRGRSNTGRVDWADRATSASPPSLPPGPEQSPASGYNGGASDNPGLASQGRRRAQLPPGVASAEPPQQPPPPQARPAPSAPLGRRASLWQAPGAGSSGRQSSTAGSSRGSGPPRQLSGPLRRPSAAPRQGSRGSDLPNGAPRRPSGGAPAAPGPREGGAGSAAASSGERGALGGDGDPLSASVSFASLFPGSAPAAPCRPVPQPPGGPPALGRGLGGGAPNGASMYSLLTASSTAWHSCGPPASAAPQPGGGGALSTPPPAGADPASAEGPASATRPSAGRGRLRRAAAQQGGPASLATPLLESAESPAPLYSPRPLRPHSPGAAAGAASDGQPRFAQYLPPSERDWAPCLPRRFEMTHRTVPPPGGRVRVAARSERRVREPDGYTDAAGDGLSSARRPLH